MLPAKFGPETSIFITVNSFVDIEKKKLLYPLSFLRVLTIHMSHKEDVLMQSEFKTLSILGMYTCKHLLTSHISSHLSLNRQGCWGTTDDFATSFPHFSLFSTALWDLPNSRPAHSLSSHLFLCLPCLLPPFTQPSKMVLARPDEYETRPYHCTNWQHTKPCFSDFQMLFFFFTT